MKEREAATAYPLQWPAGWERTKPGLRQRSRFQDRSVYAAAQEVYRELARLGVGDWNVVISSNLRLRMDGIPYSNQGRIEDHGVAVYFRYKKREHVLACDRWSHSWENLWAIAKHIAAMRGQERWGVGSLEHAFRAYMAIPESTESQWWTTLGLPKATRSRSEIESAFRISALQAHPDRGGSDEDMARLNEARREALLYAEGELT